MSDGFYTVELTATGGIRVRSGDFVHCELHEGNVPAIFATFHNLRVASSQRADDYAAGLVSGLVHCSLTGEAPVVRNFEAKEAENV